MQYHTQFNTQTEWRRQFCSSDTRFDRYVVNPKRLTLFETGDKLLVESCYDKVWGTGKPLFKEDCLDVSRRNQGILGEILCEIRPELQDISVDNIESRT